MAIPFPAPPHMPCPNWGDSVARDAAGEHRCDPERKLDYVMFQLRAEVASFDRELGSFLDSPQGRFEQWDAERRRSGSDR